MTWIVQERWEYSTEDEQGDYRMTVGPFRSRADAVEYANWISENWATTERGRNDVLAYVTHDRIINIPNEYKRTRCTDPNCDLMVNHDGEHISFQEEREPWHKA